MPPRDLDCAVTLRGSVMMNSVNVTRFGRNIDGTAMLFHHDVVADRQAKAGAFTRGLGGKEGVENPLLHFLRDTSTIVAYPDFHLVAQAFCGCAQRWFEGVFSRFLALGGGIEAVGNQIEKNPRDL